MKEEEKLNTAVEEPVKSKKDTFMESFGSRFPDVDSGNEDDFYGALNGEFDRISRSDKAQKELGDLLVKDPRSAGFLMVLKDGGNPMKFLIEQYGDEFREALNDEAKAEEFAEAFAKYSEKRLNEQAMGEKAEQNIQKMLDELDAAQADGSFSDEDATKAYEYLYGEGGLYDRILTNEISKDDWTLMMKAAKYDDMLADADVRVNEARQEGEITGRNANIDINKRKQDKSKGLPTQMASSSGSVVEPRKKDGFLEMLDSRRKSVWDD